jgi:hypothetical protein
MREKAWGVEIQGFFAALRMTTKPRVTYFAGEFVVFGW